MDLINIVRKCSVILGKGKDVEGLECASSRRGKRKRVTGAGGGHKELLLLFSFLLTSASGFYLPESTNCTLSFAYLNLVLNRVV